MKWTFEQLSIKFREVFEKYNPEYPKSVFAPGFKEAWEQVLLESGWTDEEFGDALEERWSGHIP